MNAKIRLVRIPNLIIVALTMYLVRYCILIQYLNYGTIIRKEWISFTLSGLDFFLLTLSTVLITAGGYVINDYFDVNIDEVNKPEKVIIGKEISRKSAFTLYGTLSIIGVVLSIYVAVTIGNPRLCLISVLSVGLLWFYSSMFKKIALLGNLIIAVLSALIPMVVGLYEPKIYNANSLIGQISDFYFLGIHIHINNYAAFILGYGFFAFLITIAREIIKDVEDMKGDSDFGCRTLPVIAGIRISKVITSLVLVFIMYLLGRLQLIQLETKDTISFWYFMVAVQLPLAVLIIYNLLSKTIQAYHTAGLLAKAIMVTGLFSMLIFYYSLPSSIPVH